MKFRKKPVVVEAHQVLGMDVRDGECGGCRAAAWAGHLAHCDGQAVYISTLKGTMRADVGDWIIRGVKGEFYPCKPDIFAATYEPASASPEAHTDSTKEPRS